MGGSEGRQEPVDDGSVVEIYGRRVDVLVDKGEQLEVEFLAIFEYLE